MTYRIQNVTSSKNFINPTPKFFQKGFPLLRKFKEDFLC